MALLSAPGSAHGEYAPAPSPANNIELGSLSAYGRRPVVGRRYGPKAREGKKHRQ